MDAANSYDIAVVGGGLVGMAAAIIAAKAGARTLLLAPKGPVDRRTSALMTPSVDMLISSGLLSSAAKHGHPLTQIRIIDATGRLVRAPETLFDSSEAGLAQFGWNFPNAVLMERFTAIAEALPTLTILTQTARSFARTSDGHAVELEHGTTATARLLIGADGKKSPVRAYAAIGVRERSFAEAALVCDLNLERQIGGTSIEFHYPHGPFTLVPAGDHRANLVWIDEKPVLGAALEAGPEQLAEILNAKAQRLFGRIEIVSPAAVFPLSTLTVSSAAKDSVLLVGEAAHAFPPIGAQGLNLGLRDVAELSNALDSVPLNSSGWTESVASEYAKRRSADLLRTGAMVDALFRSLLADMLPAQAIRAGGLWALKLLPGLRKRAFQLGMG